MIPLMSLMIGAYILTRMMIFLLSQNHNQYKLGNIINKFLAISTIVITIVCVTLIFSSSINLFDMQNISKSNKLSLSGKEFESPKKREKPDKNNEEIKEKQAYINKVIIRNLKVAKGTLGSDGIFGEIKNLGNQTLKKVEITIYFLDKNNKLIYEKTYHPVLITDFSYDEEPLKPNYSRKFGVRADDVPSEWAKKVKVKITDIEFE